MRPSRDGPSRRGPATVSGERRPVFRVSTGATVRGRADGKVGTLARIHESGDLPGAPTSNSFVERIEAMRTIGMAALSAALAAAPMAAVAQEQPKRAEPVVVTATKIEEPQERLGGAVTVITEEQLRTILDVRRKRIRRAKKDVADARRSDRSFGEAVLASHGIGLDDLEEAILEQQRLHSIGLHFRLGEILVARGKLQVDQVLRVLDMQGKRILVCPRCDLNYNVVRFREEKEYRCTSCEGRLIAPKFLDTVAVDAVLDEV